MARVLSKRRSGSWPMRSVGFPLEWFILCIHLEDDGSQSLEEESRCCCDGVVQITVTSVLEYLRWPSVRCVGLVPSAEGLQRKSEAFQLEGIRLLSHGGGWHHRPEL